MTPSSDDANGFTHGFTIAGVSGSLTVNHGADGRPQRLQLSLAHYGEHLHVAGAVVADLISVALAHGVQLPRALEPLRLTQFAPAGRTSDPAQPVATSVFDYVARYLLRRYALQEGSTDATT